MKFPFSSLTATVLNYKKSLRGLVEMAKTKMSKNVRVRNKETVMHQQIKTFVIVMRSLPYCVGKRT